MLKLSDFIYEKELSPLQKAYREFFTNKMSKYDKDGKVKGMSKEEKSKMFAEIKLEWAQEKQKHI